MKGDNIMASFYPINFRRAIPEISWSSSMSEDSAEEYVNNGNDVWTKYESDARSLANRFSGSYKDVAHYRLKKETASADTFNFSFEHYHTNSKRGHAHIMFGNAFEDASEHRMLLIESLGSDEFNVF